MARPADLPKTWEHGTRACYVATKCRCELCRKANAAYYHSRQRKILETLPAERAIPAGPKVGPTGRHYKATCPGVNGQPCPHQTHLRKDSKGGLCGVCRAKLIWNGLVPAEKARQHLMALSSQNIGRRAVAAACDVSETVLVDIRSGAKTQIRKETETRILGVDEKSMADHALVPAKETWRLIKILLRQYHYTRGEIALELGYKTPALQIKKKFVLAATAQHVRLMYENALKVIDGYESAAKMTVRADSLKRALPCTFPEILERFSVSYEGPSGERKAYRDLQALGAVKSDDGEWQLP